MNEKITATFFAIIAVLFILTINFPQNNDAVNEFVFYKTGILLNSDDKNSGKGLYNLDISSDFIIAIEKDVPGFFIYNGQFHGLINDIFSEFANSLNKDLKVISCNSQEEVIKLLATDSVAFGVVIQSSNITNISEGRLLNTSLADSSKYVILGNKRNAEENEMSISEIINGSKVLFNRGSKEIDIASKKALHFLNDTLNDKNQSTKEFTVLLRSLDYDFITCKYIESSMYCFNHKNIIKIHDLPQYVYSTSITNIRNKSIYDQFNSWLNKFKKGDFYDKIINYYHENGYQKDFYRYGLLTPIRSLSHYDDIFKDECDGTIYNWKLLAAIGFTESKFNSVDVSHRGATGIMQITRRNARHFGVCDKNELMDPEVNISLAVKMLDDNMRLLNMDQSGLTYDNLRILLACYNAGYGHVSDAIRLAIKNNENYKHWNIVRKYLILKRKREYFSQRDVVFSGSFISDETISYVDKVISKYNEYLSIPNK